jgi:hypothetical protein
MKRSALLTRLYAVPSNRLRQQSTRLMQKLHSMPASRPTETYAQPAYCSSGYTAISPYSLAPYLRRERWLIENAEGHYMATDLTGAIHWVQIPEEAQVYATFSLAKATWLCIRSKSAHQDQGIRISSVAFYAHRSTPHLWCAQ